MNLPDSNPDEPEKTGDSLESLKKQEISEKIIKLRMANATARGSLVSVETANLAALKSISIVLGHRQQSVDDLALDLAGGTAGEISKKISAWLNSTYQLGVDELEQYIKKQASTAAPADETIETAGD